MRNFEAGTIEGGFGHREHLRVAWHYLETLSLEAALAKYVEGLRVLVTRLGAEQKFHRTLTWAWVLLLDEARRAHPGLDFDALVAREPSLLDTATPSRRVPGLAAPSARLEVHLLG